MKLTPEKVGTWLSSSGPDSDVVISTRVRFARNLIDVPFVVRMKQFEQELVLETVRWALADIGFLKQGRFFEEEMLAEPDGLYFVERHLASLDLITSKTRKGLFVSEDETVSLMVNEEDHIRFQVLASGFDFVTAFGKAAELDEKLEGQLAYAFSPEFGFLTSCPTNVGTALRVSVFLHLPGLVLTKEIERVLRGAYALGLLVRGVFGEGTESRANLFQISNRRTLGQSEAEIVEVVSSVCRQIVDYEHKARQFLMHNLRVEVEDKVFRSLGLLRGARIISTEEATDLLAMVRFGVALGIINELRLAEVTQLLILVRPANLQAVLGEKLRGDEQDERRATFIREKLVR
ncbi:MAG: protein arginine kinase [candidate division WOR-3 bacterium]|jgi:protein arginine kinase|nr:protein arginine kinase [candidate division WOR-3 bacterium]MDH7519033.1 protein arginine kinase [bacterium]